VRAALALLCLLPLRLHAQEEALLDKAVQALGGAERLGKLDAVRWKAKGTAFADNKEIGLTVEAQAVALDRARFDVDVLVDNKTISLRVGWAQGKGWAGFEQRAEDLPADAFKLVTANWYALRVAQMMSPLQGKGVKLSPLGELKINDRPAVGLKAAAKDRPELDLYFDRETGLPVRCAFLAREGDDKPEVAYEFHFGDYKEFDGLKHFTKLVVHRDGKKFMDIDVSEVKPGEKADDSTFARP
jgi:hypothetical protein